MVTPIEALADAIMTYEGWTPGSRSYRNRNPGNLRDSPLKVRVDEAGYAVFNSLLDGYDALLADLNTKVTGKSHHNLTPDSTIQNLIDVYAPRADKNNPNVYAKFVAQRLTSVLGRAFTVESKLSELNSRGGSNA